MGKWTDRLHRAPENSKTPEKGTLKTFETSTPVGFEGFEGDDFGALRNSLQPGDDRVPAWREHESRPENVQASPPESLGRGSLEDAFAERAAIVEHDGGIPRDWADGYAKLLTMRRPAGFGLSRWNEILDDAGHFVDGWARQASAFGWSTSDVFGVHPTAPEARHDMKGLIAVLRGGRVVAMSESGVVIESPSGARHTFRRLPDDISSARLWD